MKLTEHIDINITPNEGILHIEYIVRGKLTHEDYTIMIPIMEQAFKSMPDVKVNMLLDATQFEGWELEAVWDDFKFGMEHKDIFIKIGIVGTEKWQEYVAKMGDWFLGGEVEFFYDLDEAKAWLK